MIRKIISTGIFFILIGSMLKAQTDETKFYHWSFGISAGDILHSLFNTENANRSYAAFVLEYAGPHYAIQAGFRPGYNTSNTSHDGFSDRDVTDKLSFSGHLNLTRSVYADPRWDLRAGLKYDGGWSKEDIINDSGFDRVTTRRLEWNAGGGAVVDIRYRIHQRISLGTEASLIYSYNQSELQQHFTNFPDFDTTKDKITGHKINVLEPMTIYMRFHF
ncbi:MAG: hypothetical protein IPP15_22085 [Saprospiraceae bacterium]|uniref:Uncharacterized protein n=1 Tax=Candidatus Opimibacter skivensis TaxID=2982028 RepID=A0A9D7XSG7_9BACT|nr:hypothetical protein [Candidatus Opimibacter skivensis]